jgi:redox-sensitive bicupin YhaK (pirin superfamily)
MITIRKAGERGHFNHGWLDTWHTFSFAEYRDPEWMGFRGLRVINEDFVAPGHGFPPHSHRDMEIVTYVLEGQIAHKDSMGNGSTIVPGDLQHMSAGTGVQHSEFNPSATERLHLLQIWIIPAERNIKPSYSQLSFPAESRQGHLKLLAGPETMDGALKLAADARIFGTLLSDGQAVGHALEPGRHAWLQVARGSVEFNGQPMQQGDGAAVSDEGHLSIVSRGDSEVLLFDLS